MSKPKILVVEDNQMNFELVRDLLEAAGFIILHAGDAEQGIRLARAILPDLILMDFGLPGMDGLSATKVLKSDPATRHLRVIALTAHAMKGDRELAMSTGCDGYISKPLDVKNFAATINNHLNANLSPKT